MSCYDNVVFVGTGDCNFVTLKKANAASKTAIMKVQIVPHKVRYVWWPLRSKVMGCPKRSKAEL